MSKLIKCDRCGNILDDYEVYDKEYPEAPSTILLNFRENQTLGEPNLRFELCQKCTNELVIFVKNV